MLAGRDLTMAHLLAADLTDADLSQANLTNAYLILARLTDADFAGAEIRGADFYRIPTIGGTGIKLAQLYSTASYQAHDLRGIRFVNNNLAGANFVDQDLSNASFALAILTDADFSGAEVRGAEFRASDCEVLAEPVACIPAKGTGAISLAQLYSTASYQNSDLSRIRLEHINLTAANFAGQNFTSASFTGTDLTDANFSGATLTGAEFTGAEIRGANFNARSCIFGCQRGGTGLTLTQLYSTASYQAHDLSGIGLALNNLAGANFSSRNLTNADFGEANLDDANFGQANLTNATFAYAFNCDHFGCAYSYATLTGADLTAADARGALELSLSNAITANLIRPDGHIHGLVLDAGGLLLVRDYDGDSRLNYEKPPIPITVDEQFAMGPGGTLRMVFEADAWDSTISFAPGIPVTLGGTLELTFADDVNLASQLGRTFDLFDWTGVNPTGAFTVSSPYRWDTSLLYTTGKITLTAVPEPSTIWLSIFVLAAILSTCRAWGLRRRAATIAASTFLFVVATSTSQAEIYQWEYIDPADPSQGKRQSTTLAPDGAGVDAVPYAVFGGRNLTMAYLIGADLSNAYMWDTNLTNADLSQVNLTSASFGGANLTGANLRQANLTNADFFYANLTGAEFTGAEVRGASFANYGEGGLTLAQLYSTASYQARDLSGIGLAANLDGGNFAALILANARFDSANLTGADFRQANLTSASFGRANLTGASFREANLANADFAPYFYDPEWQTSDPSPATATDADFTGAEVRGANLGGTRVTLAQLYSTASYQAHDLSGIGLGRIDLSGGNFAGQNLTNASFNGANFRDADFTDAEVCGARFAIEIYSNFDGINGTYTYRSGGSGITPAQLYSTASYRARDLSGIDLSYNNFAGGNFANQNLTNANFFGVELTDADFTGAEIRGAVFGKGPRYEIRSRTGLVTTYGGTGVTLAQLYSTASYQAHDLSGIGLDGNYLAGANFVGQNLTNASFSLATLTDADFSGAEVRGTNFAIYGITLAQLYSTASYQAHDLSGVNLASNGLNGANFAGQNLENANFGSAYLHGANFRQANLVNAIFYGNFGRGWAVLHEADLTGADARGAVAFDDIHPYATTTNAIRPDGHIKGLDLDAGGLLIVRDYDGNPNRLDNDGYYPIPPIPITVDEHLAMGPGGTLRMEFESDAWDSTISFAPGIPVTLGGTLELTFAADVIPATQVGRTLKIFDWTGVAPTGEFAISSPYRWNLSNLYTTGQVTLTAVPEPAVLLLVIAPLAPVILRRDRRSPLTLLLCLGALTVCPPAQAGTLGGLANLPDLTEVRVYEATFTIAQVSYAPNASELAERLADPLSAANRDIGFVDDESYDVFYSDADGVLNPHGRYVTIEGVWRDPACGPTAV